MILVLTILFLSGNFGKKQYDSNEKIKVVGIDLPDRLEYLEQLNAGSETKQKDYQRKKERTVVEQGIYEKKETIDVAEEHVQGNVLGYSLHRDLPNIWYERDPDYLIRQDMVGKGVFVSEHMCETEVFIGQLLKEILAERGQVSGENRQYFTDWAVFQLEETDWESLDEDWEARPYAYDRDYRVSHLFGDVCYDFDYYFYSGKNNRGNEKTRQLDMHLLVDSNGVICGIQTDISEIESEMSAMEKWINTNGLFDDTYQEPVVWNGQPDEGKIILDFFPYERRFMNNPYEDDYENHYTGLLSSGDAALSAEKVKGILVDVLESRGCHAAQYEKLFVSERDFKDFKDCEYVQLENNWKMGSYDCYYEDLIRRGYVRFRYYFYPDFDAMEVDMAKAVIAECYVGIHEGDLYDTNFRFFSMTKKGYQTAVEQKEDKNGQAVIIEEGVKFSGKKYIWIPYPAAEIKPVLLEKYSFDWEMMRQSAKGKDKGYLWGFYDAAEAAASFGEILLKDMAEKSNQMKIEEMYVNSRISADYDLKRFLEKDNGEWNVSKRYDCYYIKENERAECAHFKYYFYPERDDKTQEIGRVLVIDVWLSEDGIEVMEVNTFISRLWRHKYMGSIQQCIWGTWTITEQYCGGRGWCETDKKGISLTFLPTSFSYGNTTTEVSYYSGRLMYVKDNVYTYGWEPRRALGIECDYCFEFHAVERGKEWHYSPCFIVINDTEILISEETYLYKARKKEHIEIKEDVYLRAYGINGKEYDVSNGKWKITKILKTDQETNADKYLGKELETRIELESFQSLKAFSTNEESLRDIVELLGLQNNALMICYYFSENNDWDKMIILDSMTIVLVKGQGFYLAKRISDIEDDEICYF